MMVWIVMINPRKIPYGRCKIIWHLCYSWRSSKKGNCLSCPTTIVIFLNYIWDTSLFPLLPLSLLFWFAVATLESTIFLYENTEPALLDMWVSLQNILSLIRTSFWYAFLGQRSLPMLSAIMYLLILVLIKSFFDASFHILSLGLGVCAQQNHSAAFHIVGIMFFFGIFSFFSCVDRAAGQVFLLPNAVT